MERSKTIKELKTGFIRDQVRILSAQLGPSPEWRDYGPDVDDELGDKAVDDAVHKLNALMKQHHRAVFSAQAIHHVSRQIESLYWNSISSEPGSSDSREVMIEKGTDFANSKSIARLPEQWPEDDASEEDKSRRYQELHQRLVELEDQRRQQQKKLAQYKQLKALLEPFQDPQMNIQPNLVTRDSQLSDEIDKMRMLVAKVTSRVQEAQKSNVGVEQQSMEELDPDAKLSNLLEDSTERAAPSSTTSTAKQPFVPRHRRTRTRVNYADLVKFRSEVLGLSTPPQPVRDDGAELTEELVELELAFENARMSMTSNPNNTHANVNSGIPTSNASPGTGAFPNVYDGGAQNLSNMAPMSRQGPAPGTPATPNGIPGAMAGMNVGMPMNAGHQMDLNHLYEMVLELSDVLKNNRDMTKGIVNGAEEVMRRAAAEGASPSLQQINGEVTAARIAELERSLAREKRTVEILKREQVENMKLIGEYETAVGTMVEQIRNYCQNNNMHYLAQKRHYNDLLQAERDAHLESRLDRDYWHAQTMKCSEMIRTAYRLRCEEEDVPIRVISGLQNEVRAYRNALGMEPEKPEEEYGWEVLKDLPPGAE
ncbi:hypothetical protein AJ80_04749 [Polytolypa hystricis UAMH7299]|uniref:Uncharacterized protein n=1 Tax=Polytolypa hystricis (strain UAMH7299) TaxID=1447883 RepID=A0A2B7Y937_POLH7|nr:hypothetical protein AJ80_04749 [Polytolypa hystricis UAMH7299]